MLRYALAIPLLALLAGTSLWAIESVVGTQGIQWEQNAVVLVVVLLIPVFRPWLE